MLHVELEPFQDSPDRFACNDALSRTMTVERDGEVLAKVAGWTADVPVPPEPGNYRIVYEQSGDSPYPHRSTTTWSFPSAGDPAAGTVRIPLLVVDYHLPLDVGNRPTGDTATLTVRQVTGSERRRIAQLQVWTSVDDGTTWQPATVRRARHGDYRFSLPDVPAGSGVSLRVDATDTGGSRIEQTVLDAYIA
jgi:hypothetical protein